MPSDARVPLSAPPRIRTATGPQGVMGRRSTSEIAAVATDFICTARPDGPFTDVNRAFDRLGWSRDELLRRNHIEFVHVDDRDEVTRALAGLVHDGDVCRIPMARLLASDGSVVWIEWQATLHDGLVLAIGRERDPEENPVETIMARFREHESAQQRQRLENEDSELRAKTYQTRANAFKTWLGAVTVLLTTLGAGAAWAINKIEQSAVQAHEAEQRRGQVDETLDKFDARIGTSEKKIERLGEVLVETQVQVSDSTDYLADKIDAAHPKAANQVEPPEAVVRAKDKADAVKRERRLGEILEPGERSVGDPFDDIEPADGTTPPVTGDR